MISRIITPFSDGEQKKKAGLFGDGGTLLCSKQPSSKIAVTVVSVKSQASCSMDSVESTGAPADPETGWLLPEAGSPVLLACSDAASDSEDGFVHWRAFFYREPRAQNRAEVCLKNLLPAGAKHIHLQRFYLVDKYNTD